MPSRIGDYRSATSALNPIEMEILEYALASGEVIATKTGGSSG
jgi:hypothetical protein